MRSHSMCVGVSVDVMGQTEFDVISNGKKLSEAESKSLADIGLAMPYGCVMDNSTWLSWYAGDRSV